MSESRAVVFGSFTDILATKLRRTLEQQDDTVRLQITIITIPTFIWTVECMYSRLS